MTKRKSEADCKECENGTVHAFDNKKLANGFKCDTCSNEFHRNL